MVLIESDIDRFHFDERMDFVFDSNPVVGVLATNLIFGSHVEEFVVSEYITEDIVHNVTRVGFVDVFFLC